LVARFSHADALSEWLTGATGDGFAQSNPNLSLGGHRSSTEAASLGITIGSPISGVSVLYAGGANPVGQGVLAAVDPFSLTWQPLGASTAGPPAVFASGTSIQVVEALNAPGQYLRVQGTTPFVVGQQTVTLAYLANNIFGMDNVSIANAIAGISEYRATILRNESSQPISAFQRYVATLGTPQTSNVTFLGASGSGTITTTGSFATWPTTGWCQIRNAGGTLKEIVYYTARTNTVLTIPAAGRAALFTTPQTGASTDLLYPVPGVAIGLDPAGVQSFGAAIQLIPGTSAPAGVTWNAEVTAAGGLQVAALNPGQQFGVWLWRQIVGGTIATPLALTELLDSFNAF
jgi:hypothetical protein